MDDFGNRVERLKSAKLTPQQHQILELLEEGLSYEEIGSRLFITKGTVQYHVTNIYVKLDIYGLPKAQRQRELGKFALALKHLPDQVDFSRDSSDAEAPSGREVGSEEPPQPQGLAIIQAVAAVLEDERGLVIWENPATDIQRRILPSQSYQQATRRKLGLPLRPWMVSLLTFVFGLAVGVGVMILLARPSAILPVDVSQALSTATTRATSSNTNVANNPASAATVTDPSLGALSPLSASPPLPLSPTSVASICGESTRLTAPDEVRLARSEGVSVFSVENTNAALLSNKVRAVTVDARGLWIGYFTTDQYKVGGIGQYDKAKWANCTKGRDERLATTNINALATDQLGRLWAATEDDGVAMFDNSRWHTYTMEQGLPSNSTFGLTVDKENNIWLATLEGIAKYDERVDRWSTIYTAENRTLAYNNTHAIAFDGTNDIWVGHISHGVSRYSKLENRWIHYTAQKGGLSGNKIRSIVVQAATPERATKGVWVGTADGGISRYVDGHWSSYGMVDGLPSEDVEGLAIDKYGRVWAATMGGVAYFDGVNWIRYHNLPALSLALGADCMTCPFEQNEHVWTGTVSSGLTHSRLPYADQAANVTEVCFSSAHLARTCQQYPEQVSIKGMQVITVTYPGVLAPEETFQAEIFVAPNPPYRLKQGDMLITLDEPIIFGTFEHIAVQGTVASAQPYKFADYNTQFRAPMLKAGEEERTFVSTWRLWMHTRYTGPYIKIVATVRRPSATATR